MLNAQEVPLRKNRRRCSVTTGGPGKTKVDLGTWAAHGVCDTSAVGKTGTANCSRPWIWICMVVRDLWKMVRG